MFTAEPNPITMFLKDLTNKLISKSFYFQLPPIGKGDRNTILSLIGLRHRIACPLEVSLEDYLEHLSEDGFMVFSDTV